MYILFVKRNYKNINKDRVERHGKVMTATRQISVNIRSERLTDLDALGRSEGWLETALEVLT